MTDFRPSPFLFGIEGTRATRATVSLLRETRACGVLLLGRNITGPAQARALILDLRERLGRPILFSVDHEGGWVLRFSRGLTAFPGNAALGRTHNPRLAFSVGRRMALELRALGIGLNLAPVLDVVTKRYNPGIGIRSFGADPRLVSGLGSAFIHGLQGSGVAACAKHFPGKGAATVDAHLSLPTITLGRGQHRKAHLPPFAAAVRAGAACVMTSHAAFPAWDPSRAPATFSRPIVRLLRKTLGFEGAIISDDLCMGAVTEKRTVSEAAVQTLRSGHDLLIVAHAPSLQREAAEVVERFLDGGGAPEQEKLASQERRAALLQYYARAPLGPLPRPDERLALKIARSAVQIVQKGAIKLPLAFGREGLRRIAVFWPDLAEVSDRFTFEGGPEGPLRDLRGLLARWPVRVDFLKTPVNAACDAGKLREAARRADLSLLFCFEAMRFPGQKAALEALQAEKPERLVVALLRNPWDRELLKSSVTALHAYGYRACQVRAMIEALR